MLCDVYEYQLLDRSRWRTEDTVYELCGAAMNQKGYTKLFHKISPLSTYSDSYMEEVLLEVY